MLTTSPHRPSPRGRADLLKRCLIGALAISACGQIEPEPLKDEDGELVPVPKPYEPWLYVTKVEPSLDADTIAARQRFTLTFNDYLNPESFTSYDVAVLASGGYRLFGSARYVMTRKQLIWRPNGATTPGLEYTFSLTLPDVRSATGSPLWPETPKGVFIASDKNNDDFTFPFDDRPRSFAADIEPIIEAKCARCHRDPQWGLNPLTRERLLLAPSTQRDRLLVRPGVPAGSYLMHKLLPDFTDRLYTVQPPPWDADSVALTEDELWSFERWIEGGALP